MIVKLAPLCSKSCWDDLVSEHKYGYFLQSWKWGEFESKGLNNRLVRLGIYIDTKIVGAALCIVKPSRFGDYVYVPRGPVINWDDLELADAVLRELKVYFKKEGAIFLRIDPNLPKGHPAEALMKDEKYRDSVKTIQVERAWVVEIGGKTDEALFEWMRENDMRKKVPNYIRGAVRKGVEVKIENDSEGIEKFIKMIEGMGGRKGVAFHSPDYFRKQMEYLAGVMNLFIAYYDGKPVTAAIISIYGDEAAYVHGASTPEVGNSNASYLLHWEAMKVARERGCTIYNFWGVVEDEDYHEGHPGYGYSYFKKSFGGYLNELMRAKEFPYSMVKYQAFRLQEWYRLKKARKLGVI